MSGLQIFMQREIGGWPLYTIIMAIGQMFCTTSFQITLLSGQNWQEDWQLYALGGIFLVSSAVWYALFRLKPSVWTMVLLRHRVLLDWSAVCFKCVRLLTQDDLGVCNVVICGRICRSFHILRSQFR